MVLKSGVTPGPSEKKISLAVVGIKYQINDTGLEKAATTERDGHGSHEDPSGGKGATIKRNLHGSHEDPSGEKAATTKRDGHGSHEDPSGGKAATIKRNSHGSHEDQGQRFLWKSGSEKYL